MHEQLIREKAYQIWEAEGYPEGRADVHWRQAETVLAGMTAPAKTKRVGKPKATKAGTRKKA